MGTESEAVHVDLTGRVGLITIDNPPVNALSNRCLTAIGAAVSAAEALEHIRALVVASTGTRCFAAGADIAELHGMVGDETSAAARVALTSRVFHAFTSSALPIVAAVQASAVGSGCELALACDFVVLAESAQLGLPEASLGVIPGAGGTQRLARLLGSTRAKAALMLAGRIQAESALQMGLVSRVVASGDVFDETHAIAERLAAAAPASISAIKRLVNGSFDGTIAERLSAEREEFLAILRTADAREGCAAFLAKRSPEFQGR
jgi:enoyl-CoA hydratase/carnithine racemase